MQNMLIQKEKNQQKQKLNDKQAEIKQPQLKIDQYKKQQQHVLDILGTEVIYPYQPYPCQIKYMESVINSLNNKSHALLQSPTGTGKTLCLLCAILGWMYQKRQSQLNSEDFKENRKPKDLPIRIVYSSRTHTQLKQVIRELKKTAYIPTTTVLASRDQYCIKSDFKFIKGNMLIAACHKAIKESAEIQDSSCSFFKGLHFDKTEQFMTGISDIEDLRSQGKDQKFCPYFHSRRVKDCVDIVFLPYNYLLQQQNFALFNIELQNAIIILDEAHNIQTVSEEGSSFSISTSVLEEVEKEISLLKEYLIKGYRNPNTTTSQLKHKLKNLSEIDTQLLRTSETDCENILKPLKCLLNFMNNKSILLKNEQVQNQSHFQAEIGEMKDGDEIFKIIFQHTKSNSNTNSQNKQEFYDGITFTNLERFLQKITFMIEDMSTTKNWGLDGLQLFLRGVSDLYKNHIQQAYIVENNTYLNNPINHYKLYFKVDENGASSLNLWCLDPSISFQKLMARMPHNFILTSGTLEPFINWEIELKQKFEVILCNEHIVDPKKNLITGIVKNGPLGQTLNFSYDNRENKMQYIDIGIFIFNMSQLIPNGILVIFSSYGLMSKCLQIWQKDMNYRVFSQLNLIKDIIIEPKGNPDMTELMKNYKEKAKSKKGAILLAVCRGKMSEGIDFTDELARAVFMVGVPYPPTQDPKILLKKKYQEIVSQNSNQKFNGQDWYMQQAVRAMNQAIGRVIRHKDDYGAVFLCDCRFENIKHSISKWVYESMIQWNTYEQIKENIGTFFNSTIKNINSKKVILKKTEYLQKLNEQVGSQEWEPSTNVISKKRQNTVFEHIPQKTNIFKNNTKRQILLQFETSSQSNINKNHNEEFKLNISENQEQNKKQKKNLARMSSHSLDIKRQHNISDNSNIEYQDNCKISQVNEQKLLQTKKQNEFCQICGNWDTQKLMVNNICQHKACKDCWENWIKNNLTCINGCENEIKFNQLKRVNLL